MVVVVVVLAESMARSLGLLVCLSVRSVGWFGCFFFLTAVFCCGTTLLVPDFIPTFVQAKRFDLLWLFICVS